jgi:hypothetical protein
MTESKNKPYYPPGKTSYIPGNKPDLPYEDLSHSIGGVEAPGGLPEGLWVALMAYVDDPDWLPPQGSPGLRATAKLNGQPTPGDLDWVEEQLVLQARAADVLAELHEKAPMPTQQDIMDSVEVVYPNWVGTIWSTTLMHPWSQDLEQAIKEAEDYLYPEKSAETAG